MKRAVSWTAGFLASLAVTLALTRPENLRRALVFQPVAFWGCCLALHLRTRLRAWRDRRRADRIWREFQARNLLFFRRPDGQPERRP